MVPLTIAAITTSATYRETQTREALSRKAAETLAVQAETLSGILDKYRVLPPLLARQPGIANLFEGPSTGAALDEAHRKAEEVAGLSGAKDVAFLYPDGRVLASARGVFSDNRTGRAHLIEAAQEGRLGRSAISLDSDQRAYAFASGVRRNGSLLGVVVIYVGFDSIESTWSLSTNPIFVSDPTGLVFLTNRAEWQLLPLSAIENDGRDGPIYRLAGANVPHLDLTRNLPLLDWRLHVLADLRPLAGAWLSGATLAGLVCLLLATGVGIVMRRREMTILRARREKAQALRLERMIRDRTAALSKVNASLSREVEERKQAEAKLKQAQADLVQTAKLAALGQMSAALSHEFNQPLAAIRTYADNAGQFMLRNRPDLVAGNLERIGAMTDRMAELSRTLLSFARRPQDKAGLLPLAAVLDEALVLVRPRAKTNGVTIDVDPLLRKPLVFGSRVRLSQIVVNLVNNAIDALGDTSEPLVTLRLESPDDPVVMIVADNGPGVPQELQEHIFEPFFTTKQNGDGNGIGLSIAYSIARDFGGSIALRPANDGGCVFAVTLLGENSIRSMARAAE